MTGGTICLHSKRYGLDLDDPVERRRLVLSMAPADWAAEWVRPVTPNFKMVGPILATPGKPLPPDLEVPAHAQHIVAL